MTAYCDRCGEEPVIDLTVCVVCGQALCESCMANKWGDECRERQVDVDRRAAWNEGRAK